MVQNDELLSSVDKYIQSNVLPRYCSLQINYIRRSSVEYIGSTLFLDI